MGHFPNIAMCDLGVHPPHFKIPPKRAVSAFQVAKSHPISQGSPRAPLLWPLTEHSDVDQKQKREEDMTMNDIYIHHVYVYILYMYI